MVIIKTSFNERPSNVVVGENVGEDDGGNVSNDDTKEFITINDKNAKTLINIREIEILATYTYN